MTPLAILFFYYFHSGIGADSIASENQTEVFCPII